MSAEFSAYTLQPGPMSAAIWIGEIYAEGLPLPIIFRGPSEAALLDSMKSFWDEEVRKMHGSIEARERKIEALAAARIACAGKKAKKGKSE